MDKEKPPHMEEKQSEWAGASSGAPGGGAAPIESYAVIGDCETAALVGMDGSMDWLCWPQFGSGACFAKLLGSRKNGLWKVAPEGEALEVSRRYRNHTLILETTFKTAEGEVELIDFMPIRHRNSDIVRIVRGVRGKVAMKTEMALRFDYGLTVPWVTEEGGYLKAVAGPHMVVLRTRVPLIGESMETMGRFTVRAGQSVSFVMTYGPSHLSPPRAIHAQRALEETQRFWEEWAGRCTYDGPYRDAVERSLITLKALTYRPTGGIVAAATTSLPEQFGGNRNWDYRYCWLRDATFTLLALMGCGYYDEAAAWRDWLQRAVAGSPEQVQTLYGAGGERHLLEWEIPWLSGYGDARPVRIGNAASAQLQLDIYGEILDAFFHAAVHMDPSRSWDPSLPFALVDHLAGIWREPDEGIWETRGGGRQLTYSKVMAWVAFDRAIKIAGLLHAGAPVERWQRLGAGIHQEVCARGYNEKLGSFVQEYDSELLDASLLLIPMVGFLPPEDARVQGTLRAIESRLVSGGLVLRYDTARSSDGLPPGEGAFLACSFWMVSNLALQGRDADARRLFERLLSLANDVGLLAEEFDPRAGRLAGNYPQALSHIALVNAALDLAGHPGGSRQRSTRSGKSLRSR